MSNKTMTPAQYEADCLDDSNKCTLTTNIIKLCYMLDSDENLSKEVKDLSNEILHKIMPRKAMYKLNETVNVMFNEYTFYRTIITDIRYYRHNSNGLTVTDIEYYISNNIYDVPTMQWVNQNKIFKTS